MAKFDWYQATIPEDPENAIDAICGELEGCRDARITDRGGNGYLNSAIFLDSKGGEIGRMMFGGNAQPNIRSTSHRAPAAARLIRRLWPEHRVTRLDVAMDYTGEDTFTRLHGIAHDVAMSNHLKTGLMFQPDLLERGRTYRIGSPTSPVMVRLYEKGLQEGQRRRPQDPDWTRMEIQVRPQKAAKAVFATVKPIEAWGATRWTSQLMKAVDGSDARRIEVDPRHASEWDRTQEALVQQYGRHAISGGMHAIGGPAPDLSTEKAIDAYLSMLRTDLLAHHRDQLRKEARGAGAGRRSARKPAKPPHPTNTRTD